MMNLIYITAASAKESGLTHEGTLFGVPAWFDGDDDGEIAMATPKIPVLHAWCMLADFAYGVAAYFMPSHAILKSPISITRMIK